MTAKTNAVPFDAPIGAPPTLEWVSVTAIGVDPAYQRATDNEASQKLIRKIARQWDWNLCQPLSLTRRADGSMWAVDGQHRHAAAQLRGDIPHLPCVIARYPTTADEAAAFVALNKQRKPLNAVDLFKAALAAGDAEAHAVMHVITEAGLRIAPHSNYHNWKPGMIYCVPGVVRAWRSRGPVVTANALGALASAFGGQVLQFGGLMLDGLYDVFINPTAEAEGFDLDLFIVTLQRRSQAEWLRAGRYIQNEGHLSRAQSIAKAMLDAYRTKSPAVAAPAVVAQVVAPAVAARPNLTPAPKPKLTFEQLLAASKAGTVQLSERVDYRKPDPAYTLGGVTGDIG